ncbi:hypothetical protein ACFQX6_42610 [Streptosporangium lutulentum]
MSDLGHVLVLAGGLSYEREVSLRSGRRVSEALQGAGVSVETRDTDASLVPSVLANPPDAVFVTLHGGAGEDGAIRSVLELLSIPYVGADPDACRVAFDKPTAKTVVRSVGLRTPDSVTLPKETFHDLGASAVLTRIVERLGLPCSSNRPAAARPSAPRSSGSPKNSRPPWSGASPTATPR